MASKYELSLRARKRRSPRRRSWCTPATRLRCAAQSRRLKSGSSSRSWSGRPGRLPTSPARTISRLANIQIVDAPHGEAAAAKAVELIRESKGELLMKGSLHTDELMREVTSGKTGLRTARRISHAFIMDVPTYSETLVITDAAINIFPDLDVKRDIVQNAIDLWLQIGGGTPRVAILSAVETVTSKIPSTIEAAALCKMADRGQITGGILDGPLAFDNAIDLEAVKIKGIKSEVAGPRADPRGARSRIRQHAGQEPHFPRQGRRRRNRSGRARAGHSDLARRFGPGAHGLLRGRRACCACAARDNRATGGLVRWTRSSSSTPAHRASNSRCSRPTEKAVSSG